MSYTVIIPSSCDQKAIDFLRSKGYQVITGTGTSPEELLKAAPLGDAFMARIERYPEGFVQAASKMKILARHGVGVDNLPVKECEDAGIWVSNGPFSNCETVAEATIGYLLSCALDLMDSNAATHKGNFLFRGSLHRELGGKVLGVFGWGKIGSSVAKKAHFGLGMEIVVYDHHWQKKQFPEWVRVAHSVEDALQAADAVTLHMPMTSETNGMIGEKELALMKDGSILVNLARGGIVDEQALVDNLKSGHLYAAALDVYAQEPIRKDSPLLEAPHLLLTPHNASHTKEGMERMAMDAALCIDDVFSGREPRWPKNHPAHPRALS